MCVFWRGRRKFFQFLFVCDGHVSSIDRILQPLSRHFRFNEEEEVWQEFFLWDDLKACPQLVCCYLNSQQASEFIANLFNRKGADGDSGGGSGNRRRR